MREHVLSDGLSGAASGDHSPFFDLVCFSHLRWDFVYQRPQHLLSRCAEQRRVFFFEEPVFVDGPARLDVSQRDDRLFVVTPLLPLHFSRLTQVADRLHMQPVDESMRQEIDVLQREFLDGLLAEYAIEAYVLWYMGLKGLVEPRSVNERFFWKPKG